MKFVAFFMRDIVNVYCNLEGFILALVVLFEHYLYNGHISAFVKKFVNPL